MICFRDEHSKKALPPIDFVDDGIIILKRDVHELNAYSSIISNDCGNLTTIRYSAYANCSSLTFFFL